MIPISYNLLIEKDKFIIYPCTNPTEYLIIDRLSEEVSIQKDVKIEANLETFKIWGIWGMIKLISGHFLIVIKDIEKIGTVNKHDIFKIIASQIIPLSRSNRHIIESQILIEREYLQMLETVLTTQNFYFSHTMDLTHTFQRLQDVSSDFYHTSLFERADERFVWNRHLVNNFVQSPELQKYIFPIMHGFIGSITNQISRTSSPFSIWLISRRSVHRAGTRYYSRGCDNMGNSSNFVETEQILFIGSEVVSFVQTRGSIPLVWNQKPNLYYKPNPQMVLPEQDQVAVLSEHFNSQIYLHKYGPQIVINLLNQNGSEKPLGSLFARILHDSNLKNVKYVPFDFHNMCKHMKWDKLNILMETLQPDMLEMKYLHVTLKEKGSPKVHLKQNGVFRTNCIDCLDRTNVVQSMVAWCVLEALLVDLQILPNSTQSPQSQGVLLSQTCPELHFQYKNLWADNGDTIAIQYTGTGALKSDFTRTGKRSASGVLADGYKSSIRYVLNNFRDGFRQDAMELFLGNYIVDSVEGSSAMRLSPLQRPRGLLYRVLPWLLIVALCMLIIRVLFPTGDWSNQAIHLFILLSFLLLCVSVMFNNGYQFVNSPRLKKDD